MNFPYLGLSDLFQPTEGLEVFTKISKIQHSLVLRLLPAIEFFACLF